MAEMVSRPTSELALAWFILAAFIAFLLGVAASVGGLRTRWRRTNAAFVLAREDTSPQDVTKYLAIQVKNDRRTKFLNYGATAAFFIGLALVAAGYGYALLGSAAELVAQPAPIYEAATQDLGDAG